MSDTPPKTHNSDPKAQVKVLADRIARLLGEAEAIRQDVSDIYSEAKGAGYNVPALRAAVQRARLDPDKRKEAEDREEERDLYLTSIVAL